MAARQALTYNASNTAALEVMTRLASDAQAPQMVDWQRRLALAAPTIENRLDLALMLARLDPPPFSSAAALLDELRAEGSNRVTFHLASAELAVRQSDASRAATHFEAIRTLDPGNLNAVLNLGVLRLQSTNNSLRGAARIELELLRTNQSLAAIAGRWLVRDALREKNYPAASKYAEELARLPQATFDDRLQHVTILSATDTNAARPVLDELKMIASTNAPSVYALSSWLLEKGRGEEAQVWWRGLPEHVRTSMPAPLARVDYLASKGLWLELEAFLQQREWGDSEFLRSALLSEASHGLKEERLAETRWRSAVHAASGRYPALMELLRLSRLWGRAAGEEDVLWSIAQRFPAQRWAYNHLDELYARTGDTRGLHKLYTSMMKQDPTNALLRNNVAAVALLLEKDSAGALDTAQALHRELPTNAVIASTYAFALYRHGRAEEGLKVLSRLDPALLEKPSFALYQAVMLLGVGRTNEAAPYLRIALNGRLLPEEKALLPAAQ